MASTKTTSTSPTIDAVFGQIKDSSEQVLSAARQAGNTSLDVYEKTVDRVIKLELELAGRTEQEWLKSLIETQAGFARELTESYTGAARTLLS